MLARLICEFSGLSFTISQRPEDTEKGQFPRSFRLCSCQDVRWCNKFTAFTVQAAAQVTSYINKGPELQYVTNLAF